MKNKPQNMKNMINQTIKSVWGRSLTLTFGLLLFSFATMNAQISGLFNLDGTSPPPVNSCNYRPCSDCPIRIEHRGGYVATIEAYYKDSQGKDRIIFSVPRAHVGECLDINTDYLERAPSPTGFRIRVWAHTGLVWAPKKLIFDEFYTSPRNDPDYKNYSGTLYRKYKIWGTTLSPKWETGVHPLR